MEREERKTGVVLIVHEHYGAPLLDAARALVGELDVKLVEAPLEEPVEQLRGRVLQVAAAVDSGGGVLLLTDLCGSTPANCCLHVLATHPGSEMVAGLNLPMLIKLSTCDRSRPPAELAEELARTAQRSIQKAGDLLDKGARSGD